MDLKDKAFKYLESQIFFWLFHLMLHMYLEIGKQDDDFYNDGESSDKDYYE